MSCVVCGEEPTTQTIVPKDKPMEPVAKICGSCRNRLIFERSRRNTCAKCDELAVYGTQQSEQARDPADASRGGSLDTVGELLLCERHFDALRDA